MANSNWEEMISLNSRSELTDMALGPPADYLHQDRGEVEWDQARISRPEALAADTSPLPSTEQREGYYGSNHYNFWASGLRDYCQLLEWLEPNQIPAEPFWILAVLPGAFCAMLKRRPKLDLPKLWAAISTVPMLTGLPNTFRPTSRYFKIPVSRHCRCRMRASTWLRRSRFSPILSALTPHG